MSWLIIVVLLWVVNLLMDNLIRFPKTTSRYWFLMLVPGGTILVLGGFILVGFFASAIVYISILAEIASEVWEAYKKSTGDSIWK